MLINKHDNIISIASGVFLISLSALVYEIALTRVLSVILAYHYVFLVISGAVLGLSLGGFFEYWWQQREIRTSSNQTSLAWWAACVALSMSIAIFFIVQLGKLNSLLSLGIVAIMPFFFTGVVLATVFRRFATRSAVLYGADLIGAALGALLVVETLNLAGAPNSILAAGLIGAVAALMFLFGDRKDKRDKGVAIAAFVITAVMFGFSQIYAIIGEVPVGRDPDKDMFRILNNPSSAGNIIESRWSAFGRTDLVRFDKDTDSLTLFIDGAAGTSMYKWEAQLDRYDAQATTMLQRFSGAFPYLIMDDSQKDNALIIGPGGGRDVVVNLLAGVKQITAVEVNPDFVDIVRDYSSYNGGIYTNFSNVNIVVDDGRNYLNKSHEKFDIIMLALPITKSGRGANYFTLSESYLFTIESMQAYLSHLTDEGSLIVVAHNMTESVRVLMTALAALKQHGVGTVAAMKRLYVLGHPFMPVVVINKQPLSTQDAADLHAGLHRSSFDSQLSYIPTIKQIVLNLGESEDVENTWRMMNQNMFDLAKGEFEPEQWVSGVSHDIAPVTDDSPFFYNFELGIPRQITGLFWAALLLTICVVFTPWMRRWRKASYNQVSSILPPWEVTLVLIGLGVGFIMIELSLFQKLVLFLGHPTSALSLLLFSLLIGTGVGSLISAAISNKRLVTGLWVSAASVTIGVFIVAYMINYLAAGVDQANPMTRVSYIAMLIALGISLGFPFPLTIRLLKQLGTEQAIPWAWAVNGAAAVTGSVLVIIIAMKTGYNTVLMTGAFIYLAIAASVLYGQGRLRNTEVINVPQ